MLLLGTVLVDRPEGPGAWRLGVQLGSRGWFVNRRADGTWCTSSYGPDDLVVHLGDDPGPPEAGGGVREPRTPRPSAGGAAATARPGD